MGEWMKINGESIYGTKASPFGLFPWGRCTKKDPDSYRDGNNTTLYFSVFDWPKDGKLFIPGLKNKIMSAKLLANVTSLKTEMNDEGLIIVLPAQALDANATVIKVEVKGAVEPVSVKPKDKMKAGELD
jgi:alpha-L-fucosidase